MTTGTEADGRTVRAKQKRKQRRRDVLEAAMRVFSSNGYHATRIADIIQEANIARGTFYLYFDSKNAIFQELVDLLLVRLADNVNGVDLEEDSPPVREQLLATVRRVFAVFRGDPGLARVIFREAVGIDAEIDAKLDAFYAHLHGWLAESLSNGQTMGFIRPMDVELTSWLILGSVKQYAQLVLDRPDDGLDLDHLAEVILDYNLQGIMKA